MPANWNEAPSWAKFAGRDSDGEWSWFAQMPLADEGYWVPEREKGDTRNEVWVDASTELGTLEMLLERRP